VNFVEKVESCAMIRFVRVTYVRPVADMGEGSAAEYHTAIYSPPSGFNYRTFLPAPVKVGMCSGSPVYETVTSTCERSKVWLRCVGESSAASLADLGFFLGGGDFGNPSEPGASPGQNMWGGARAYNGGLEAEPTGRTPTPRL